MFDFLELDLNLLENGFTESKKPENTEVCQPKRVISRIRSKRLQDSIDSTISKGNGNETLETKASVGNIM